MKQPVSHIVLFGLFLFIGWLIPRENPASTSRSESTRTTSFTRPSGAPSNPATPSPVPSTHDLIDLDELEGVEDLTRSPLLRAGHWTADSLENADPGFITLVEWLKLSPSQQTRLATILRQQTHRRRDWEKANLHPIRQSDGVHLLTWIDHDPQSLPLLREGLVEAFGEILALTIWIRGGLHHFFEPLPGWNSRRHPEIQIVITCRPPSQHPIAGMFDKKGDANAAFSNGDWNQTFPFNSTDSPLVIYPRLDHLFDHTRDLAALKNTPPALQPGYPVARLSEREGFVISPHSGKMVDVRDIPPGTLVMDPGFPASEKAYFRIPPEPSE